MYVVMIFKNAKQLKERSVSLRSGLQRPLKLIKHIIFRTEASPKENIQKEKCWEIHCVYEVLMCHKFSCLHARLTGKIFYKLLSGLQSSELSTVHSSWNYCSYHENFAT